jgi:hypothetical protein
VVQRTLKIKNITRDVYDQVKKTSFGVQKRAFNHNKALA